MQPKKITLEEATQIHKDHANMPMQRVTICYAGQWYDIRGMTGEEIEAFVQQLIGYVVPPEQRANITISI